MHTNELAKWKKDEYYSSLHNVDTNLIKTIVFLENACGHYLGLNALADYMEVSKSQMPMNIRGDMWGNFNGKYYDTNNHNKNIELGTLLVKQICSCLNWLIVVSIFVWFKNFPIIEISGQLNDTSTITHKCFQMQWRVLRCKKQSS